MATGITYLVKNRHLIGPVNVVSPGALDNAAFAKAVSEALKTPAFLTTPAFVVLAIMGQMGDELAAKGQHV